MWIDKEELLSLMEDFYKLAHVRIVVLDEEFLEVAAYPDRHSRFCRELRSDNRALAMCKECDYNACMKAKRTKQRYIYRCHAGLTEAVAPIIVDEKIVGYIMLGQILQVDDQEKAWEKIELYIKKFDLDYDRVKKLYFKKRNYSYDKIVSVSKIMEACAAYLLLYKMIVFNEDSSAKRLDEYIQKNIFKELNVDKICNDLGISRVKLYAISERTYGMGIAEYIRKIRVDSAQKMLIKTDEKISDVAEKCGFYDYNYFTKVFRKYVGLTPRDYRKKYKYEIGF